MEPDPLDWLEAKLAKLDSHALRRRLGVRDSRQEATIQLDGQPLVNFGSNDYLGLAGEPLCQAVRVALEDTGWGAAASPLITGRASQHARLEQALASFEGTEAALLFSSGFAANVGAITSLAGPTDTIFSDAKNHASIIDGCRLSGAEIAVYRHADLDHLQQLLKEHAAARRKLIVTDTLFSMDGDLAPLAELAILAEQHGAMLMVDEAHATGVFGENGRGVCEAQGVECGVHIRIGTLSKALGSMGGFVAGSQRLIDWLTNRARSYIFSTAPPAALAAAGLRALELVRSEPHRRQELLQRAERVRGALRSQGWNLGRSSSQIIPLIVGKPGRAMELAAQLRRQGLLVPGIRPPSVPNGEALLRISLSYAHPPSAIETLLAALQQLRP